MQHDSERYSGYHNDHAYARPCLTRNKEHAGWKDSDLCGPVRSGLQAWCAATIEW